MAFGAARDERAEYIKTLDFSLAQRRRMTMGVAVVGAVQRHQRSFEGGEGAVNLRGGNFTSRTPETSGEKGAVGGNGIEGLKQVFLGISHLCRAVKRSRYLLFQRARAAVPEQALHKAHIPQAGGRTEQSTAADTKTAGAAIGKAFRGVMTTGAGGAAVPRQYRIEKKIAPQIDDLRRKPVAQGRQPGLQSADAFVLQGRIHLVERAQPADTIFAGKAFFKGESWRAAAAQGELLPIIGVGAGRHRRQQQQPRQQADRIPDPVDHHSSHESSSRGQSLFP